MYFSEAFTIDSEICCLANSKLSLILAHSEAPLKLME